MKILKLVIIAIAAIVVFGILAVAGLVVFMGYVGTDTLSNRATDSQMLAPDGTVTGKALVVYNPGLSGNPKTAAKLIAGDLRDKGYEVCLAGINSTAAADVSRYDVIVAGGPIYGGVVSSSVQSYLTNMVPPEGAVIGAFAIGNSYSEQPFPAEAELKTTAVISQNRDMDSQCAEFTRNLLE